MPEKGLSEARIAASFRDPSGYVFFEDGVLLRSVAPSYLPHLRHLASTRLYETLIGEKLLVEHEELEPIPPSAAARGAAAVLKPERVEFISYPYEWCFGQLKDAALATLRIQRLALDKGMWLKDASAYNIQFHKGHPVLIDTLSFEIYEEGAPWPAYRQFCEHFLAPLVLMSSVDIRLARLLRDYIDGIPLDLAAHLVPGMTKFNPGLAIHLHAHAKAQATHANSGKSTATAGKVSKNGMIGIIDSLKGVIEKLEWKPEGTVWGDYYSETNYSDAAFKEKRRLVGEFLDAIAPRPFSVWDLGGNTGEFSSLAGEREILALSWDIDPAAVEKNYRTRRNDPYMLPLLQDLTNPSPGIGWAGKERESLTQRGPAGAMMALALVHHLAIGNNVPLGEVSAYFAEIAPWAIVEFVPKADSQVQRLLATRKDIYDGYTPEGFEAAFANQWETVRKALISGSERSLYLFRRRAA